MDEDAVSLEKSRIASEEQRTEVLVSGAKRRDPGALDRLIEAHLDDLSTGQ